MLLCATTVMAQVTTSSMSGKVSLQGTGEDIVGATVQAIHEPSGTRYAAVTNADGRFNIQGMRTGGPYKVTVSYIGYQSKSYNAFSCSWAKSTTSTCSSLKTLPCWAKWW